MQSVVERGTHTSAFLASKLSRQVTLKYDYFREKANHIVHNQLSKMKALRDRVLMQLQDISKSDTKLQTCKKLISISLTQHQ